MTKDMFGEVSCVPSGRDFFLSVPEVALVASQLRLPLATFFRRFAARCEMNI